MKRAAVAAFLVLFSATALADYTVVLRSGQQYKAKAKPRAANGKVQVNTTDGQTLSFEESLIDWEKSEQATKLGLGTGQRILDLDPRLPSTQPKRQQQPSLGDSVRLRQPAGQTAAPVPPPASGSRNAPAPAPTGGPQISNEVLSKFERAYEGVGLFGPKLEPLGPSGVRATLTADNEDKVFNAISATAFLMVHNAGVPGVQIDTVELFMAQTGGGSSGRFQMNRNDAAAINGKQIAIQDYFVRNVIY